MTYLEAMDRYVEYLKTSERSPHTIQSYKGHLQSLNTYLTAKYNRPVDIDEIKADDVEQYLFEPPNDKKFTQVTRRAIVNAYKAFFTFCDKKGYTKTDIGAKLPRIQANSKERGSITEAELFKILEFIPDETDKAFIQTMFYAGLRISEANQLVLEDIHPHGNYLHIRKHKSKDDRKVPISIKLGFILRNYLENHRPKTANEKVFTFTQNHPVAIKSHINACIKKAVGQAGLNISITSHTMRHSFASNLIERGVSVVKVQKLLGHGSLRTTNIYLHAHMDALKQSVNTL